MWHSLVQVASTQDDGLTHMKHRQSHPSLCRAVCTQQSLACAVKDASGGGQLHQHELQYAMTSPLQACRGVHACTLGEGGGRVSICSGQQLCSLASAMMWELFACSCFSDSFVKKIEKPYVFVSYRKQEQAKGKTKEYIRNKRGTGDNEILSELSNISA